MASFTEVKNKFLQYLQVVKNSSDHTIRNYSMDLEQLKEFVLSMRVEKEDLLLPAIDKRVLRNYLAHLSSKGSTKRTILRRVSSLRSFFKYLLKEKLLTVNPMEEIESPKLEKTIPTFLDYAQVERLFSQPDISSYLGLRDRCIMEVFYSSGLRVSELVGLNREDCNETNLLLRVRGKGKKRKSDSYHKKCSQLAACLFDPSGSICRQR